MDWEHVGKIDTENKLIIIQDTNAGKIYQLFEELDKLGSCPNWREFTVVIESKGRFFYSGVL